MVTLRPSDASRKAAAAAASSQPIFDPDALGGRQKKAENKQLDLDALLEASPQQKEQKTAADAKPKVKRKKTMKPAAAKDAVGAESKAKPASRRVRAALGNTVNILSEYSTNVLVTMTRCCCCDQMLASMLTLLYPRLLS